MSTMWSMCSMSTGHCSTHAPQVVHDHSTSGSMTPPCSSGADQRAGGLLGAGAQDALEAGLGHVVLLRRASRRAAPRRRRPRGVLQRSLLVAEDVGRLGEQVVAQVHDDELGRQRLSGVPRRALRLAAPALGAGGEVEVALPGEVLDLAAAEHRVLGGILEVDRLALVLHRQQRAQARSGSRLKVTLSGARPMCRCLECSTISRKTSITPMCSSSATVSMHSLAVWPSGLSSAAHAVREERAPAVGQVAGVHRRAAEQRVGPDDVEDHEQDQPGAAGVRAVEAGVAAVLLGLATAAG